MCCVCVFVCANHNQVTGALAAADAYTRAVAATPQPTPTTGTNTLRARQNPAGLTSNPTATSDQPPVDFVPSDTASLSVWRPGGTQGGAGGSGNASGNGGEAARQPGQATQARLGGRLG